MRRIARAVRNEDVIGFEFPGGMLDRLGLEDGDELFALEQDGGILLTKDKRYAEVRGAYDVLTVRYSNTLRDLADS